MKRTPEQKNDYDALTVAVESALNTSTGILPHLFKQNPWLKDHLQKFLTGEKIFLLIGGEPGNGKSLIGSEIILLHSLVSYEIPEYSLPLSIITWDKVHELFYHQMSLLSLENVSLPQGETPIEIRQLVSETMLSLVQYVFSKANKRLLILIETPMYGSRGEQLLNLLPPQLTQTLIVHSPQVWKRIINEGKRLSHTSGQIPAMLAIRQSRLAQLNALNLPWEEQNFILKKQWEESMQGRNAKVIEWSPDAFEPDFEFSKKLYSIMQIRMDSIKPHELIEVASQLTRKKAQSYLDLYGKP